MTTELQSALAQFIGTEKYYRFYPKVVLTDGTKYLADTAGCYWLMDLYASHLASVDPNVESFTCLKLIKRGGTSADIVIEDGNTQLLAQQHVEYTDFPLENFVFYAVWSGEFWVLMLRSEY